MIAKNLLLTYHKHLFANYFPNFKTMISNHLEEVTNNVAIKIDEALMPKRTHLAIPKLLLYL